MKSFGSRNEPPGRGRRRSCDARTRPIVAALAVVALLCSTSGCALVGAGVGSMIPKYEPLPREPVAEQASSGQEIRVVRASDDQVLRGRYDGVYDEKLWILTDQGASAVETRDVKSAQIAADNHWLEGFLAGLVVDVAVVAIVGANIQHVFPTTDSQYHVGADGVSVAGH